MIELNDRDYIAEGVARKVYQHPEYPNRCIKIGKAEIEEHHLYKEINYHIKIKSKNRAKFDYPFFAEYHGEVSTNLGKGFIYDLIRDESSQSVSLTLRHYIEMPNSPLSDTLILEELEHLKQQMIKNKIFVGDLRARNICCKMLKDGSVQFIVIDGLGHRDFLPLADWFGYFARKKVERRFVKANLQSLDAQRDLLKRLRASGTKYV